MRCPAVLSFLLFASICSSHGFRFNLNKLKLDSALKGIKRMEVDVKDTLSSVFDFGSEEEKVHHSNQLVHTNPLGKFSIETCGPKDQPIIVKQLKIQPDPLYFPGPLKIGFDVEFKKDLGSDLSAKVELDVNSSGQWIHIPCLGLIGSCQYKNLCSMLQQIDQCPDEFQKAGVPCHCPFRKGEYKLPFIEAEIDASVFLAGDYRGNITMFDQSGKEQLGCYKLSFTVG